MGNINRKIMSLMVLIVLAGQSVFTFALANVASEEVILSLLTIKSDPGEQHLAEILIEAETARFAASINRENYRQKLFIFNSRIKSLKESKQINPRAYQLFLKRFKIEINQLNLIYALYMENKKDSLIIFSIFLSYIFGMKPTLLSKIFAGFEKYSVGKKATLGAVTIALGANTAGDLGAIISDQVNQKMLSETFGELEDQ